MKNKNNHINTENREEIPAEVLTQVTGGEDELSHGRGGTQMPKCSYCRSNQYVTPKGNCVYWCDFCKKLFKANN